MRFRMGLLLSVVMPALLSSAMRGDATAQADQIMWQPHYYGWSPVGVPIVYTWTDKDGRDLGPWHAVLLPKCFTVNIPLPPGAEDVRWRGPLPGEDGDRWCNGKSTALRQESGQYYSDFSGFYSELQGDGVHDFYWPSGFRNALIDEIHFGVDIREYYRSHPLPHAPGQTFTIVNGRCDALPGFLFGTSEVYLDTTLGLYTENPIASATLATEAEEGICPEPASVTLLVVSAFIMKRRRTGRRKP